MGPRVSLAWWWCWWCAAFGILCGRSTCNVMRGGFGCRPFSSLRPASVVARPSLLPPGTEPLSPLKSSSLARKALADDDQVPLSTLMSGAVALDEHLRPVELPWTNLTTGSLTLAHAFILSVCFVIVKLSVCFVIVKPKMKLNHPLSNFCRPGWQRERMALSFYHWFSA